MIKTWSYKEEYIKNRKTILKAIDKTLFSGNLFFGNQLKKFENSFIKQNKSRYGVAVGSGTDALIIALIIRSFLIQPFYIPSSSMQPNLLVGDRLFVSKYSIISSHKAASITHEPIKFGFRFALFKSDLFI